MQNKMLKCRIICTFLYVCLSQYHLFHISQKLNSIRGENERVALICACRALECMPVVSASGLFVWDRICICWGSVLQPSCLLSNTVHVVLVDVPSNCKDLSAHNRKWSLGIILGNLILPDPSNFSACALTGCVACFYCKLSW